MNPVKESLYRAIESLSDEEARQILELAQRLHGKEHSSPPQERLPDNPTLKVSRERPLMFRVVEPIQGQGVPASQLLVEDRR